MSVTRSYLLKGLVVAMLGLTFSACTTMTDAEKKQYLGIPAADFLASPIEGEKLFAANCSFCHGKQLQGSSMGPALTHAIYDANQFADTSIYQAIKFGVRQRNWKFGEMPSRSYLSPEKAGHIVAFIRETQQLADSR